jgi:hypothetical protein
MIRVKSILCLTTAIWFNSCGKVQTVGTVETAGALGALRLVAFDLLPVSLEHDYKEIIQAQGGLPPYNYSIMEGQLLEGLSLNPTNGHITGKVSKSQVGKFQSFTLQVTDSAENKATQAYLISAASYAIDIFPEEVPSVTPTVTYALKFNASHAVEPVTYAVTGTLPTNLVLASDGALQTTGGTVPASAANTSWTITVTATDANKVSASKVIDVTVGSAPELAALVITSTTLSAMQVGAHTSGSAQLVGRHPYFLKLLEEIFPMA